MSTQEINQFIYKFKRIGKSARVDKAKTMLTKTKYNLMVIEGENEIHGVMKSQTNPNLLYAVKLTADGNFLCGTQNLRRCGGLRGAGPCKHLYLLALALLKSGSAPQKITKLYETAVNKSVKISSPEKQEMEHIFQEYAARMSGDYQESADSEDEIEWREIETDPEDYMALS